MMMKKIRGTTTMLILAAAAIALAACSNVLDPPQPGREAETGTVYIVIDGDASGDRSAARTLAPEPADFTRYTASFEGPGTETQADLDMTVGNTTSVNLAPGYWTITVTAFTGEDIASGRGSATAIEVVSNQTATANITITPITGGGRTGDFRYSVAIPAVDAAVLNLTDMTTLTALPSIDLKAAAGGAAGTAAGTLTGIDAGYYLMNIHLEQAGKYAGKTEVVHIYDGLETLADYAFADHDFGVVVGVLAEGVWQDGEIFVSASGSEEYYRLPVTEGETYAVYWNDSYEGDLTKDLEIKVSANYETGGASIFSGVDSGYYTPQLFTAASSGNVILRVAPYNIYSTGTYAVLYGEVKPLTVDTPESGDISAGGVKLYRFSAAANTVYEVSWEDSGEQAGNLYDGDITVTAYRGSIGSTVLFTAEEKGDVTPQTVSYAYATVPIYLKVDGVSAGTYSVKYEQIVQHTITFDAEGGSPATLTRTVKEGGTVGSNMPSTPTRDGYIFGGWHTGQNGGGTEFLSSTTVIASIPVYAKWTGVSFTVAYYKNAADAGGSTTSSTHTYGTLQNLTPNGFNRTGYNFAGWNTQQNGGGTNYTDGQDGSDLSTTQDATVDLYAKWTGITYTVVYHNNAAEVGESTTSSTHTYGTAKALTANSFTRTGHNFVRWSRQPDGGGASYANGQSVINLSTTQGETIDLYAQWENTVQVNISLWANQDGSILASNNNVTISQGIGGYPASFTATVESAYSGIQWYLYGDPVYGSRGKARSIRINAADYAYGTYVLGVTVTKDGASYSTEIRFTVSY
jgi:uncharacterized repeat protein (TIGR02543 family)